MPIGLLRARPSASGTALPTVSAISPNVGDTAGGGGLVTITGTTLTGATGVTIGGTAATSVTVVNATTVTCIPGARAAGTSLSVLVTTPGGTNGANTLFEYWTPAQITGIDAYLDANKGVTASAGAVGTWVAQDAGAKSFTQATGVNKPVQTASVFGSLPSIRLTPQQWVQLGAKQVLASGLSWFFVAKYTSTRAIVTGADNVPLVVFGNSNAGTVYDCAGASNGSLGYQQFIASNNQYTAGSGFNDGNPRLLGWTHDTSGNLKGYAGATQQGATITAVTYSVANNGYDIVGAGTGSVDGFAGDLGAVISVSGIISGSDLTKLNSWSKQRWGTP